MARTGRPREFDEDVVLDRVTGLFWRQGYDGTSLQELVDVSGLQRASLYGAFGNKKALLLRALARYRSLAQQNLQAISNERPVLPALREFLVAPLRSAPEPSGWGCLFGKTAAGLAVEDEQIRSALAQGYAVLETGLHRALASARDAGEIADDDLAATVHLLLAVQQGLHVVARADPEPARLADAVDTVLDRLVPRPSSAPRSVPEPG